MSRKPIEYKTNEIGCHLVTSHYKNKDGYVQIRRDGKLMLLHRYVYEQEFGSIPEGQVVRHKCDNPSCINTDHLDLGTQQENIRDMYDRDRSPCRKGEKAGNVKLTEEVVIEILRDFGTTRELADKYGVSKSTISDIRLRKIWTEIKI